MFETVDAAELAVPPVFSDEGRRAWFYVAYSLHLPWFYITYYARNTGHGSARQMLCLTRVEDLLQLSQSDEYAVTEVNIVSPAHMNGVGRWAMEPMTEIWRGAEREAKNQVGFVFVTASGARYLHSVLSNRESELLDLKLIFQAPAADSPG